MYADITERVANLVCDALLRLSANVKLYTSSYTGLINMSPIVVTDTGS